FISRPVDSSKFCRRNPNPELITEPHTYTRFVCGLKVMGAHDKPPSVPGAMTSGSVQYAPKMHVLLYCGSTLPGQGQIGTYVSPIANGCVFAVFIRGSCSTGRSSMPMSGLPFVRSR